MPNPFIQGMGVRGARALGFVPGAANLLAAGRTFLCGPPGASVSATNTVVTTNNSLLAIPAYIGGPCILTSITVRTSSSNASSGASLRLSVYSCGDDGLPGTKLAEFAAGAAVGDAVTSTLITQTLDIPLVFEGPQKVFIVAHNTFTTTGARFAVAGAQSAYAATEGATTISNGISAVGVTGYSGSAVYSQGSPNSFGTATAITTAADSFQAAYTIA